MFQQIQVSNNNNNNAYNNNNNNDNNTNNNDNNTNNNDNINNNNNNNNSAYSRSIKTIVPIQLAHEVMDLSPITLPLVENKCN